MQTGNKIGPTANKDKAVIVIIAYNMLVDVLIKEEIKGKQKCSDV